jgi:hypothetical protein
MRQKKPPDDRIDPNSNARLLERFSSKADLLEAFVGRAPLRFFNNVRVFMQSDDGSGAADPFSDKQSDLCKIATKREDTHARRNSGASEQLFG